ncbi:MAG: hypothetical protein AAFY66_18275, partial [Pseudomonadota bacterium]
RTISEVLAVEALTDRPRHAQAHIDAIESRGESEPVVQTQEREVRNRRAVTMVAGFDRIYVGLGMPGPIGERLYRQYLADGALDIDGE